MKENNDNIIIGFYHIPGESTSTIYTENLHTHEKEIYKVNGCLDGEEAKVTFKSLQKKYPNGKMVEFKY